MPVRRITTKDALFLGSGGGLFAASSTVCFSSSGPAYYDVSSLNIPMCTRKESFGTALTEFQNNFAYNMGGGGLLYQCVLLLLNSLVFSSNTAAHGAGGGGAYMVSVFINLYFGYHKIFIHSKSYIY